MLIYIVSIFDLEDDTGRSSSQEETTLPLLLEPSQAPRQKSHQRSRSSGASGPGLPQSLSSLRPISLPSPSGSRLLTDPESSVISPEEESVPEPVINPPESELSNRHFTSDGDDAMLKLVAAHTPSHRGLWDKDDGKALRMIMGEGDATRMSASKSSLDSETASINDETGRFICENSTQKPALTPESLGWTSYEPPEDIARSLPVSIVPPLASKKSTKPERPRVPPELPLPLEPNGTIEESVEEDIKLLEGEGRGRERALQIIQARNQLPEPGMWRSLA